MHNIVWDGRYCRNRVQIPVPHSRIHNCGQISYNAIRKARRADSLKDVVIKLQTSYDMCTAIVISQRVS